MPRLPPSETGPLAHPLSSKPDMRIGPRHPILGAASFHFIRWLATRSMARIGFHVLGSDFAAQRIASIREKLNGGATVYLAGIAAPGTHNTGVALVEVTQANGPRIIVNNEEERFSGDKHTTEYPRQSLDAMIATLRSMGRDVDDIAAFVTTWDYPALFATLTRSVAEEAPAPLGPDVAHTKTSRQAIGIGQSGADDLHAAP
jgi:carbamoyltransferase